MRHIKRKQFISKLLSAILTLTMATVSLPLTRHRASATSYTEDYFTYIVIDEQAHISAYDSAGPKDVVIPGTLGGYAVTRILFCAFYDMQITSVSFPEGLTTIEDGAFSNNLLTSLTIPSSVTFLSGFAANKLTTIEIPSGVKQLGIEAFGQNQLASVVIPKNVNSIGDWAFSHNKLTSIELSEGVKSIGNSAFHTNQLTSVVLPQTITYIGSNAFCENALTSIAIPGGVNHLSGFSTNKLATLSIPYGITRIEDWAFWGNQLSSVYIPSTVAHIAPTAFTANQDNPADLAIVGHKGSYAEQFARDNGHSFFMGTPITDPVKLEAVYPLSDQKSTIMAGGKAYRYYLLTDNKGKPLSRALLNYRYDGDHAQYYFKEDLQKYAGLEHQKVFQTVSNQDGIIQLETPVMKAGGELKLVFLSPDLSELVTPHITTINVEVSERTSKDEYSLILGLNTTVGKGLSAKLGPSEVSMAKAGLAVNTKESNSIAFSLKQQVGKPLQYDLTLGNSTYLGRAGELSAGPKFDIIKETLSAKVANVSVELELGQNLGTGVLLEQYNNKNSPNYHTQVEYSALYFLSSLVSGFGNNIILKTLHNYLLPLVLPVGKATYSFETSLETKGSFVGLELEGQVGDLNLDMYNISVLGGETETVVSREVAYVPKDQKIEQSSSISKSLEAHYLKENLTPDADVAVGKYHSDITVTAEYHNVYLPGSPPQRVPNSITYSQKYEAASNEYFVVLGKTKAGQFEATVSDGKDVQKLWQHSPLLHDVVAGSIPGSLDHVLRDIRASGASYDWLRRKSEISTTKVPFEIEIGAGIMLGLGIELEMINEFEYETHKGQAVSGPLVSTLGEMLLERYEKDDLLQAQQAIKPSELLREYGRALGARAKDLFQVVSGQLQILADGVVYVVKAGADGVVQVYEMAVNGAAYMIDAGQAGLKFVGNAAEAGYKASVAAVKSIIPMTILTVQEQDLLHNMSLGEPQTSVAVTVGDFYAVSFTDEEGNPIAEFTDTIIELTLHYTDGMMQEAGVPTELQGALAIYRWDGESGFYVLQDSFVDTDSKFVVANITYPGQYLLAIDTEPPTISSFAAVNFTSKPSFKVSISDTLSGVDSTRISFYLDEVAVTEGEESRQLYDPATGIFSYQHQSSLSGGEHVARVTVYDRAGNFAEKTISFVVDDQSPIIADIAFTLTESGDYAITAEVNDDTQLQRVYLTWRYRDITSPITFIPMHKGEGNTYSAHITAATLQGSVLFSVQAADQAGNITLAADHTIEIPLSPLQVTSFSGHNGSVHIGDNLQIAFSAPIAEGAGFANIRCQSTSGDIAIDSTIKGNTITIRPVTLFSAGDLFTLVIPQDSVVGPGGQALVTEVSLTFAVQEWWPWQQPLVGSQHTEWTVKFSQNVSAETIDNKLYVLPVGSSVPVLGLEVKSSNTDPAALVVSPPPGGWVPGEYHLYISDKVRSEHNEPLKQSIQAKFIVAPAAEPLYSSQELQSGAVTGVVIDPQGGVANATVEIYKSGILVKSALSSEQGDFAFSLSPGIYTVRAAKIGHASVASAPFEITLGTSQHHIMETVLIGDANQDGYINAADIVPINRHALGIDVISGALLGTAADINGDGFVNAADIVPINRHALGIELIAIQDHTFRVLEIE